MKSKNEKMIWALDALSIFLIIACSAIAETPESKWQEKMSLLAETMSELLPELSSQKADVKILEKGAKSLSELSHSLEAGRKNKSLMPALDNDPSIMLLSEKFSKQAKFAHLAIKNGNLEYGKNQLRSLTSYCIACHTRHENGPQYPYFPLNPKTEKLSGSEKAELFIATRQFDRALQEIETLVKGQDYSQWQKPLRHGIALAVRVKRDPELALQFIQTALKSPNIPEFERAYLHKWVDSLKDWKKEPKGTSFSESKSVREMRRLVQAAHFKQSYQFDRSGEIEFLRASGVAHDILRITKQPQVRVETLYTIGTAYEVLSAPLLWPAHELWYEQCIHELPHSPFAEKCFHRLEESIHFGYTGSAGTAIPNEVQEQLTELKALAFRTVMKEKK